MKFSGTQTKSQNCGHKSKYCTQDDKDVINLLTQLVLTVLICHNFHGFLLIFLCFCLLFLLIRDGCVSAIVRWCIQNMHKCLYWETKLTSVKLRNSLIFQFSPKRTVFMPQYVISYAYLSIPQKIQIRLEKTSSFQCNIRIPRKLFVGVCVCMCVCVCMHSVVSYSL